MIKLSQGFCVGMAAFACGSAVAAPLQIPTNVPIVEVAQQTNTYNYTPVNETNSTIKRVVPISDALVTGQSVSDVEPKVSTTRRLPIGTGADVTASVKIPKRNIARGLIRAAKVAGGPSGLIAGLALEALIDYGLKNASIGSDGRLIAGKESDAYYPQSDGYIWRQNYTHTGAYYGPEAACVALTPEGPDNWKFQQLVDFGPDLKACRYVKADGNVNQPFSVIRIAPSDCKPGYYVDKGVCTSTKPLTEMSEQEIEDWIASRDGWPTSSSVALAEMLKYPDTRRIIQDYPSNGVEINGPASVKGKSTTATEGVQLVPGTTTVAPPGTPSSQTQPGTKTTTTTATHPITYSGSSVSHSTVNNTTTNITNNTTNVTTTETKTEEVEDDKDDQMPSDTALGDLPKLYEQKYPEGLSGVWNQRSQEFKSSGLFSLAEQLMPTSLNGGTCPSFDLDLSIGSWADYGTHQVPMPCWIWDTCKYILLLMAAVSARRIVLGG
ncbi:hypothetical protein FSY45_10670 [Comamonas sp. Z1]|uniref:hypothetical protein n=1 Tax=Comamonas sp. Z1 TaxID=2601246 RepID=UPI0011E82B67|nr:hypothetical protein [Comamonas sp. Z1]TYK76241.1 hypothetical protein FSY45_10670 [Comamonas sp. Z1]